MFATNRNALRESAVETLKDTGKIAAVIFAFAFALLLLLGNFVAYQTSATTPTVYPALLIGGSLAGSFAALRVMCGLLGLIDICRCSQRRA